MSNLCFLALINNRPVVFVAEPIVRRIGIFITRLFAMSLDERACAVEFAVDGLDGDLSAVVLVMACQKKQSCVKMEDGGCDGLPS